jgi:predicted dehydrogenase
MSDHTRREFLGGVAAVVSANAMPLADQPAPYKMAVVGLVHAHVWGHLADMQTSKDVTLAGVAEPNGALRDEAKKAGVPEGLLSADYRGMIEQTKPDLVWAFVENNRHLEIVEYLAPKKINIIFEKPLRCAFRIWRTSTRSR